MTAPHTQCQPEAATPYQHACPDGDCIYLGQPSFRGCGCHKTREQMMLARIEELTKVMEAYRGPTPEQYETLRRTLETHAVKLMGPRSPFWRCQYCEALSQSPLMFPHKPECVMAASVPLERSGGAT